MRSAVRWRAPVSSVGIEPSGMKCTPASRMFDQESSRTIPPSILESSASRAGLNMAPFKCKAARAGLIHLSTVAQHDQAALCPAG